MRLTVGSGEKVVDPFENNSMLLTIVVKMGMGYIVVLKELKGILLTQKESHEQSQHLSKVKSGDIKVSSKIEVFIKLLFSHSYVKLHQ